MKAKELIQELMKMDPEAEVVVDGDAIHFVEQLPGYYDGYYETLIENPSKKPYYSVEGVRFSKAKQKIRLHMLRIDDIIWNCENKEEVNALKWEFDASVSGDTKSKILKTIEEEKEKYFDYLKKEGRYES